MEPNNFAIAFTYPIKTEMVHMSHLSQATFYSAAIIRSKTLAVRDHSVAFSYSLHRHQLFTLRTDERVRGAEGRLSELESTKARRQGKVEYRLRFRVGQVAKRFCSEIIKQKLSCNLLKLRIRCNYNLRVRVAF